MISLLFILGVTTLHAEPLQKTIEGAKKEGKVVFYTTLAAPESQAHLRAFQKTYPFIQPELFRLGPEKLRSKILTEARAGRYVFDVTSTNIVEIGVLLRQRLVAPYEALGRQAIPTGL